MTVNKIPEFTKSCYTIIYTIHDNNIKSAQSIKMLRQYIFVPMSVFVIHSLKLLASDPALMTMIHNGRDFNVHEDQTTTWVIKSGTKQVIIYHNDDCFVNAQVTKVCAASWIYSSGWCWCVNQCLNALGYSKRIQSCLNSGWCIVKDFGHSGFLLYLSLKLHKSIFGHRGQKNSKTS